MCGIEKLSVEKKNSKLFDTKMIVQKQLVCPFFCC